jgi:hypothetical protein
MPLRKSHAAFAAITALAVVAPASASAATATTTSCTQPAVSSPFKLFGDLASYWLAPDGGFENGGAGWKFASGAKVVAGNETFNIVPGTKSLQFASKGIVSSATTPSFCVDASNPAFRFLVKSPPLGSVLNTFINFTAPNGQTLTVGAKANVFNLIGGWTLAASQPLSTAIPSIFLGAGTKATITFQSVSPTTGIQIDDLMIGPYRRG